MRSKRDVTRDGAYGTSDAVAKTAVMVSIMAKTEVAPALDGPGEREVGVSVGRNSTSAWGGGTGVVSARARSST